MQALCCGQSPAQGDCPAKTTTRSPCLLVASSLHSRQPHARPNVLLLRSDNLLHNLNAHILQYFVTLYHCNFVAIMA